ncbi:phosphomannomutase [Psychrobacter sp. 16-MNA-CIBAN-0192]|uniref:phosphomannomutase n=1 Tax=Psychrobacter sp. 16-MNA-CIBAN-0192 TaxID=3140448 RepID=UPI00332F19F1
MTKVHAVQADLGIQVVSNIAEVLDARLLLNSCDNGLIDDTNNSKDAAMMTNFTDQHDLFRAYDIRGARQLFTQDFIHALGNAFARLYLGAPSKKLCLIDRTAQNQVVQTQNINNRSNHHLIQPNTVVIGYDARCNSDTIAHTLADILHRQGLTVIYLGLVTTPMMAFWAERYDGHGIMVTASHSKKDILGVKWLVGTASPSYEDIETLYQNLTLDSTTKPNNIPSNSFIHLPAETVAHTYIAAISHVMTHIHQPNVGEDSNKAHEQCLDKLAITVVIDCMHGATSNIAQPLFERFCQRVILLNDTPDGNFPSGNPDPTEPNRLAELQQTVMVHEADMGLAFDGDGDRLMIVDNRGKVVAPDHLLYLLAQVAMTERAVTDTDTETLTKSGTETVAPQVLFDVKCSHHLPHLLTRLGAVPVMTRTGSSLLRQQLAGERQAIFAGELSGHFIFNDGYFMAYDDAMYSGLRLLHWLTYTATVSQIEMPLLDYIANNNEADKKNDNAAQSKVINIKNGHSQPMTTGVWGEPKPLIAPFQLTDITQHLPLMVSTADHYLPLPTQSGHRCYIIEHLISFCHHLQELVQTNSHVTAPMSTTTPNKTVSATLSLTSPLTSCRCAHSAVQPTLAQAHELLPLGTRLSCIDGLRLDFEHGFGILRNSNTSHSLTVRFAGNSSADLQDVQARFVALCRPFHNSLAEQIATICPE